MNKEEIFAAWAPETSIWSRWVKPVLFAYLDVAAPVAPSYGSATSLPGNLPLPFQRGEGQGEGSVLPPESTVPTPADKAETATHEPPGTPTSLPASAQPAQPVTGTTRHESSAPSLAAPVLETNWVPAIETRSALVLDLPGAEGVRLGLDLAARGYRPVPLYNAVPVSSGEPLLDLMTGRPVAAVQVLPIVHALKEGATSLGLIDLPADAPPVFLLDAHRRAAGRKMLPDEFDNRSVCFTTDFPSANFLFAQRIGCVVLVQRTGEQPQLDLAHVLRRWQQSGITVQLKRLDAPGPPVPCEIQRPSWFGTMFQRALSMVGLHYGEAGGFGGWVTDTSAGG